MQRLIWTIIASFAITMVIAPFVITWLKKLKFHKKLFGGIPEQEVWKRMSELNAMYEVALAAERARCDALIEQIRAGAVHGDLMPPGRRAEHE